MSRPDLTRSDLTRSDLARPDPAQPDRRPPNRCGLRTDIRAAKELSTSVRDEMYLLFARAYDGTDRARFDHNPAAKRDVLLLQADNGRIAGFTTLAVFDETDRGQPIR